jgi:solute carrier family 39 (zinc transporter), member 1/2/3
MNGVEDVRGAASLWTDIPTALLKAELLRRQDGGSEQQPACGSGHVKGLYNTPLHVGALILILVLSTLGTLPPQVYRLMSKLVRSSLTLPQSACSFPIVVRRFPSLPVPHYFLFLSRHFGTGVLIATAFVHLLPTAFVSLTDSCLPPFWNHRYPAMPGLIAMVSVLAVVGIEMFFATRGAGHVHGSAYDTIPEIRQADIGLKSESIALNDMPSSSEYLISGQSPQIVPDSSPLPGQRREYKDVEEDGNNDDEDLDLNELDPSTDASDLLGHRRRGLSLQIPSPELYRPRSRSSEHQHRNAETGGSPGPLSEQQQQRKLLLQCLLLEAGILFHSVFIGMALSVATGTSFIVLLVAISFHRKPTHPLTSLNKT